MAQEGPSSHTRQVVTCIGCIYLQRKTIVYGHRENKVDYNCTNLEAQEPDLLKWLNIETREIAHHLTTEPETPYWCPYLEEQKSE